MRRFLFAALVAGLAWVSFGEHRAQAQSFQLGGRSQSLTRPRPTVSPFLNLGRGGSNAAVDYYGLVRPQMDANRSIGDLQQGFSSLLADGTQLPGQVPQNTTSALGG